MNGSEETKKLTLEELYTLTDVVRPAIRAKSGFDGKILCESFDPKKHPHLAKREVTKFWPSIKLCRGILDTYAKAIIECYLFGGPEYEKKYGGVIDENA